MPKKKRIIAISGLSGGGKSTAAKALEDGGFFVIDNLPPQLLEKVVLLVDGAGEEIRDWAFVVDAREQAFLKKFPKTWERLRKLNRDAKLLFFEASDDTVIKRYKETRRRHPLEHGAGMRENIAYERSLLHDMRGLADEVIHTDNLNVHELKDLIRNRFTPEKAAQSLVVTLMSFGFKYGLPPELDTCFDARFLKNPHFVEKLRPLSGLDEPVSRYVLTRPNAKGFITRVKNLLEFLVPQYQKEGKSYLNIGVGCTGGRHRAPALTVELHRRLALKGVQLRIEHRDVSK
jgi:UPF0042 nucleotide-binding protein